ncbi:MAG: hypothetical protein K6U03_03460, partial [Firmicutes bacterium]|nr:hypothetical protein [Bacillota bacterium]
MMVERHFLVVGDPVEKGGELRVWPWLRMVPGPWRRAAGRFLRPKAGPVGRSADGLVNAYAMILPKVPRSGDLARALARAERELSPCAYGWTGPSPVPFPELPWRSGRLFGLLAALSPFLPGWTPLGDPARLTVLLLGGRQPELAVAARFLAHRVRGIFIVCPAEHFRRRLAAQLLIESGLAVLALPRPPRGGWDVAIDFRVLPPRIETGDGVLVVRPLFPHPLALSGRLAEAVDGGHPVWAECHLACLAPPEGPPLPFTLTLASLREALALVERLGLGLSHLRNGISPDVARV